MFFTPKNIDEIEVKLFWEWFAYNESWIIDSINSHNDTVVIEQINEKLLPVFPYFKKKIKFIITFRNGQGKFFFCGQKNKYLNRDASILKASMPYSLTTRWEFIIVNP